MEIKKKKTYPTKIGIDLWDVSLFDNGVEISGVYLLVVFPCSTHCSRLAQLCSL